MKFRNKNKVVIFIFLPVLLFLVFRLTAPGHFKVNAKKWAEPSLSRSNLINERMLGMIQGNKLLIYLEGESTEQTVIKDAVRINPATLLSKLDMIKEHVGPVILSSSELSVSVRIWMILSQMGYNNIYILTDDEMLKYKFRPETTGPEL